MERSSHFLHDEAIRKARTMDKPRGGQDSIILDSTDSNL